MAEQQAPNKAEIIQRGETLNGEILFISNKEERAVYVNFPDDPQTYKLIPKQDVNDTDLAIKIDEIRKSEDIPNIFDFLKNPNNPEQIPKIDLKQKLINYLNNKIAGIYAYQVFNVVIVK